MNPNLTNTCDFNLDELCFVLSVDWVLNIKSSLVTCSINNNNNNNNNSTEYLKRFICKLTEACCQWTPHYVQLLPNY